jgi:crotonobetainyl-CoA:carnitine CoA-transferase CaiB-like acyl-CoA transferase
MSNVNKRGITLDLGSAEGRELFDCIVGEADVLVENFTPRVLDNFGIRWDDLHAVNRQLILVRMPGFGLSGPWRDRPGFAQTMEQVSGMAWLTGFADGPPLIPRGVCDPLTSLHAAFAVLAVLAERERTGEGRLVECSMLEAALNVTAELVIERQVHGVALTRDGNRSTSAAPQSLYGTRDDERWLALSVEDDAQWDGLCAALGRPTWCLDGALADVRGRRAAHDVIDAHLGAWAREREVGAAVELLLAHGVPAAAVTEGYDLVDNPQLTARGFFEWIETELLGRHAVQTLPFRLASSKDAWITRPPPTLGEHNDEVLGGELGLPAERLAALRAANIIGDRPLGVE